MLSASNRSIKMAGMGMSITKTMPTAAAGRTQSTPNADFLIGLIVVLIMLLLRYVAPPAPVRDRRTPESLQPLYKACWELRCRHPRSGTAPAPVAGSPPWERHSTAQSV